jgi:transposase
VIVDALGNPLALRLTGGQVHDITQAQALAAEVQPEALLGDKGYDADSFIQSLEVRAIKPVIPPKSNRKVTRDCDFALYAERNLIERSFNSSNSSEASRPATKKPRAISSPASIWSAPWLGSNEDTP